LNGRPDIEVKEFSVVRYDNSVVIFTPEYRGYETEVISGDEIEELGNNNIL
jgi:hypothetical protein